MSGDVIFDYQKAKSDLINASKEAQFDNPTNNLMLIAYYNYMKAAEEYIKQLQFLLGNKVG